MLEIKDEYYQSYNISYETVSRRCHDTVVAKLVGYAQTDNAYAKILKLESGKYLVHFTSKYTFQSSITIHPSFLEATDNTVNLLGTYNVSSTWQHD